MNSQFYDLYKSYNQKELFDVLLHANDYQPEAVASALQLVKEKGWSDHYQKLIDEKKQQDEKAVKEEQTENLEKAEYYRKAVLIKTQNNSFEVRIGEIPKFEARLAELNVDYFREDKNIGTQLDVYPTQTYYFKNEDVELVDKVCKEVGVTAAPYLDPRLFFFPELKMAVGAILFLLLAYLLYYISIK